jgi:uncharacterized membrane protein YidH (DUF202 family)
VARTLALLVVAGGFALGFALVFHGVDETREPFHDAADLTVLWLLSGLALLGAALLAVGSVQWYGPTAQILRGAGFCALLLAALGVVSFAFVLVPIVMLAIPALFERERPG